MTSTAPPPPPKPDRRVNMWLTMVTVIRVWLRLPGGEKTVEQALNEAKRKEGLE